MALITIVVILDFIGKILIIIMALLVHDRVRKEGKIDRHIMKNMQLEQFIGYLAIILFVTAFIMELYLTS